MLNGTINSLNIKNEESDVNIGIERESRQTVLESKTMLGHLNKNEQQIRAKSAAGHYGSIEVSGAKQARKGKEILQQSYMSIKANQI